MAPPAGEGVVERLRAQTARVAEDLRPFEPPFEFTILWAPGYDELFSSSDFKTRTDVDGLLREATRWGRIILAAEGGSGKTSIVRQLFHLALSKKNWPVLIDMRDWRPPTAERWTAEANSIVRMDLLLTSLAKPKIPEADLSYLPGEEPLVLLVDGLNEVEAGTGHAILQVLDDFAKRHPSAAVVVTDRLLRREVSARWGLATIAPLTREQIARLAGNDAADNELLRSAFFLDIAIQEHVDASSSARAIRAYLHEHTSLPDKGLQAAARASFLIYERLFSTRMLSRSFPLPLFKEHAGDAATSALAEAHILIDSPEGVAYFRHHLFHDYLASAWLVGNRDLWRKESFNALTFEASSFESLAMALEQIADSGSADLFVRRIYDWNFYAPAYALSRARAGHVAAVTSGMETALLTMLAEKRWDPIRATSQRVTDALRLLSSQVAQKLLAAADLTELLEIVREMPVQDEAIEEWKAIFTTPPNARVEDSFIARIAEEDSLAGWTVANVLRRIRLTEAQLASMREMIDGAGETVRWRIVHALGAHPSEENVSVLFDLLTSDEYMWVRYGAVRSLVECAARSSAIRDLVFEGIRERIEDISRHDRVLEEFEKAVVLREPPPGWADAVGPVIEELWAKAETLESQEHWRQLGYEVQIAAG
jgi:hypothetical protein